jgi:hypothetical protein
MRGPGLACCAWVILGVGLARGQETAIVPRQEPRAPAATAEGKPAIDELKVGDSVTLQVDQALRTRCKKLGIRDIYVIASRTLEPYKEIDAYVGPRGHIVANSSTFVLPSGQEAVPLPDHSQAVVLEIKPADGIVNDTTAVRVRLIDGPYRRQEFWVRRSRMVLRSHAAAPAAKADSLLRQARALEKLGKVDQARRYYQRIVREHPEAAEAAEAARTLKPGARRSSTGP